MLKVNIPLERHASEVFDNIGEKLYHSGSYVLEEVATGIQYLAKHIRSDTREKWCKVSYRVDINDSGDEYSCECGNYEHSGLLCSHILKVSVEQSV